MRLLVLLALLAAAASCGGAPPSKPRLVAGERVSLRIDATEAEAALALVGAADPEAAWQRVVATDGYRRLVAREQSMKRTVDPAEFRAHVAGLGAQAAALRTALARWQTIDLDRIAARVFAYLPADAKLNATIYPVIKPRDNSFVYFDDAGAAIFMFLDPATPTADVETTIAHELHHIGYASLPKEPCTLSPARCSARMWTSAFGEGFAMLAAAGGRNVHPRGTSRPELRADWDRAVAQFDEQLVEVEDFLRAVVAGTLDEAAARERAMSFFGVQGPWYTLGYSMALLIEGCDGRTVLLDTMRKPWRTLAAYNGARDRCPEHFARGTAIWSPDLVDALD